MPPVPRGKRVVDPATGTWVVVNRSPRGQLGPFFDKTRGVWVAPWRKRLFKNLEAIRRAVRPGGPHSGSRGSPGVAKTTAASTSMVIVMADDPPWALSPYTTRGTQLRRLREDARPSDRL
jgi:hypothetical protein